MKRPVPTDAAAPTISPTTVISATCVSTSRTTLRGSAPSAMRMPISFRRRVTAYDITP